MRKILAVILMIVAGLGLILCVGGLIGVWLVNTPVTDAVTAATQTAESYLALAGNTTSMAGDEIASVHAQLDAFGNRVGNMTAETRAAFASEVSDTVQSRLGPTISTLRTTFATLRTGIVALNQSLESANRIPGVNIPTLTDELQAADQRLEEISGNLAALKDSITDVTVDGSKIEALILSTSGELASLEGLLDQWSAQIAAVSGTIAAAGDAAPGAIDLTSVVVSLLMMLFGAGQVCLIARAVRSFRTQSPTADAPVA